MRAIAIIPAQLFNVPAVRSAVDTTLDRLADETLIDFQATVATWDDAPTFAVTSASGQRVVSTDHQVYRMLNRGTRAHVIRAQTARALVFQVPYQAKTAPRVIGSRSAGVGSSTVYTREVHHPGTAARAWDQAIAEKYQGIIGPRVQQAIGEAVQR